MKKLLAKGSGDIYQICKAFRKEEYGRLHNPEFTILEWYRINFNHHDLMDEMDELLKHIINTPKAERYTYKTVCEKFLEINPHKCCLKDLKNTAQKSNILTSQMKDDFDEWLQLLFTHLVEPQLGLNKPAFIYDFPKSQAMLAKVRDNDVASRFEVYYKGVELANGFHELNDPAEQKRRFEEDLKKRKKLNLSPIPIDEEFLSLLKNLPNCSGVALGVDRLILLASEKKSLNQIL